MTDLRRALRNFDAVSPDDAVFHRARSGPSRSLPLRSGRGGERVIAALTAALVFALAGAFAWRALGEREGVDRNREPVVDIVALGADGSTLWPQRSRAELVDAQAHADAGQGGSGWQLDRDEVVARFAETVLGWPSNTYQVTLEPAVAGGGATMAHLERTADTCPSRTADDVARGVPPCFPGAEDVSLVQPVTHGPGGLWAVRDVQSPAAPLPLDPGQVIENGTSISVFLDLPEDMSGAWAVTIGGTNDEESCFGNAAGVSRSGELEIEISIQSDAAFGTTCGSEAPGYVTVHSSSFRSVSDPLNGDSSPYVAVSAIPILVTIPENELEPGTATYEDPMGWKVDHPSAWFVKRSSSSPGNTLAPGVWISNMEIAEDAAPPPEAVILGISPARGGALRDDSSFPLSMTGAFQAPRDPFNSVASLFRGNGVWFAAQLVIGEAVPEADLARMADVFASIRFPSLRAGELEHGLLSLGDQGYPPGRGSPANPGEPFGVIYVMRGPGGDYALDLDPDSCGEGQSETWDDEHLQVWIRCPDGRDARYERDGTPVSGNPPGFTEPLLAYPVITAWDGSLLVSVTHSITVVEGQYWPT